MGPNSHPHTEEQRSTAFAAVVRHQLGRDWCRAPTGQQRSESTGPLPARPKTWPGNLSGPVGVEEGRFQVSVLRWHVRPGVRAGESGGA